jgi:HlyD family secretion protein
MIRDTSAQDRAVQAPASRRRLGLLARVGAGLAVLVALGLLVMGWASSDRSVSAARVRTAEVTAGTFVRDVAVEGRVVAAVSPTLYAPVGGTVTLEAQAGATVKRGTVLARIDSPELTNELAREQSTLASLEAEVGRQRITARQASLLTRRTTDEAELALTTANRDLQRAERGHDLGVVSEVDLLAARDAVRSAEIRLGHAKADNGLAQQSTAFDLTTRERALERQALVVSDLQRRVEDLQVRAPVDGIVGTVSVTDRAVVVANAPLVTVVDLSRLEVELEAPETYADDLGIGMSADVRIGSATAPGRISAISPEVVASRVRVRVAFEGTQPEGLRQNQRVNARILIDERADTLMLPRGPFIEAQGGRTAWVVEDGVAVRRPIRLGATSVTHVEVLEGLAVGETVVIAGTDTFADAERVQLND